MEPRPAASILLLRTGPGGDLELFSLLRAATMAFAAGATAYPGGAVDPSDAQLPARWAGPGESWWREHLGLDEPLPWVVCAVRELFEEVGVALVREPVVVTGSVAVAQADLATHRRSLAQVSEELGWTVDAGLLRPWARWITPPGGPRRYDTLFLVAALPAGQDAVLATTEAVSGLWSTPADLLERHRRGEIEMMPPTRAMAEDLLRYADLDAVLRDLRSVTPVQARIISRPGEPLRVELDPLDP